jgi:hypothetical protein
MVFRGKDYTKMTPRLSEFYGVKVYMYWEDHNPPHFHAEYAGMEAVISIDPIHVLAGIVPPRVISLVLEWAAMHQIELRACWAQMRFGIKPALIPPLI